MVVETDWREILSFSQRELRQADKEKLCESISWMEADDIELNFSDLKTLFRLAQDILKYKNEQVNNLMGKLESANRKLKKGKSKSPQSESPASTDSAFEIIAHQEEVIQANKEILEQLYADIAELEGRKNKLVNQVDKDSSSSRDALSEMDAVLQLENEVALKNKHIRKLLGDIKVLEDENSKLKEKVPVLKNKLLDATQLIDNLTEQLLSMNNDCKQLKDMLGDSEKSRAELSCEIESLRKELLKKDSSKENIYDEIKSKVQHWKNVAKTKKIELESVITENEKLKRNITAISNQKTSNPQNTTKPKGENEGLKMKELQDRLIEAANEMEQSANIINLLRNENKQLKGILEERDTPESTIADRNESDDGKQRILIDKLKTKVKSLTVSLRGAEEMVAIRERELTEIAAELQLLQSNESINSLLQGLKHKKQELKVKDEGIKSLVREVNNMSQIVSDLQLENEALRQQCNIPAGESISTDNIVKKYRHIEKSNFNMSKELRSLENKLVNLKIENRSLKEKQVKLMRSLLSSGHSPTLIEEIIEEKSDILVQNQDPQAARASTKSQEHNANLSKSTDDQWNMKILAEENEGLRKGLQEILDFLKDNSTTSSGVLSLQCPSLEALLRSMEARHAAGWFSPHMSTIMELRAALGSKDALLTALHEARKETFDVMSQLSLETKKSTQLERKLKEIQRTSETINTNEDNGCQQNYEFGSWIFDKGHTNIDLNNKAEVQCMIEKGNIQYESQLQKGLQYFHEKFRLLYDKISLMAVQAADESNKWSLQEEQYKAEIENLKTQIQQHDEDDFSDNSPGLVSIPSASQLQRKCVYLEESYKYIRTLNENIKNENMDAKRQIMAMNQEYETEIQRLILTIISLMDKLRNTVPLEMFWKQHFSYNETILKYRKVLEENFHNKTSADSLAKRLEKDKLDIISTLKTLIQSRNEYNGPEKIMSVIEETVLKKQIESLCKEVDDKSKKIQSLEKINKEIQETQSILIDSSLASITEEEFNLLKSNLLNKTNENNILKQQCHQIKSQLEIALLQLQEEQQRKMCNDIEVNLLRHQVLDLQSSSDNKAIVARLSGEVLVAHLQASECNKKIEQLNFALNKEKESRIEVEEMLKMRQKIFDVYSFRYESKFRYIYEVMQVLRQQYQGSVPLVSIENYLNNIEVISRDSRVLNEKLQDIEDLRSSLMAKHSIFDQILDVSKNKCVLANNNCSHKLKAVMTESMHTRELDYITKKLQALEKSHSELIKHCNDMEKTLILLNQGFEKPVKRYSGRKHSDGEISVPIELVDVHSDDDTSSSTRKSKTITLPEPQQLRNESNRNKQNSDREKTLKTIIDVRVPKSGESLQNETGITKAKYSNTQTQTSFQDFFDKRTNNISTQTDDDIGNSKLKRNLDLLQSDIQKKHSEIREALLIVQQKNEDNLVLSAEKINLVKNVQNLETNCKQKDQLIESLRSDIATLKNELEGLQRAQLTENNKQKSQDATENKCFLLALQQLENDKNMITTEYKDLLNSEREEYSNTIRDLNVKVMELQSKLDRKGSDVNGANGEALKEVVSKYTVKIVELEDKSFKLQSELDEYKTQIISYQSEVDRWKELATERLIKMEHLNSQLVERHCQEVESYKQENQHWLSQLNDTQREHMELRNKLSEQKAIFMKQLAEKDGQIEQMRTIINNLKGQIMSMQTMISVHDPSFDLSAIVEVDEASDGISQPGSDRLEIKFDSSGELNDISDEFGRIGSSSTTIWQEPVIERLRRDKQLVGKQNAILRRQIKALAARERRSRLDAQNLKNQVFRISSSGNRVATAESAALHNKIATLQAQLTSARRDTHSSIALWDKWKRAQQSADRWKERYEDKCQEVKKLEASIQLTKAAVLRLEKEKRVLLARISELRGENQLSLEKQERETPEKSQRSIECATCADAPQLSNHALLERVQAQQRRIVALTLAEKGNEHLVSEYEKALAEITSLKGQVLKLESALLEAQIRSPLQAATPDPQPELQYWKSYCEMLKEENVQLNMRVSSLEATSSGSHKINDLEQTVLTLRGLVSKLQSEQKSSSSSTLHRRADSRPGSGRSTSEKGPTRLESHRIEIANLKRSIQDKDLLLERSKEMLKIAAEREDELLRENAFLRRHLNEVTKPKEGFLSA